MMDKFPNKDDGWKKGNLLSIKRSNKGEMLIQLASYYVKFLNDDFLWVDVENIYNIHL
jgi:hypothetical protein